MSYSSIGIFYGGSIKSKNTKKIKKTFKKNNHKKYKTIKFSKYL